MRKITVCYNVQFDVSISNEDFSKACKGKSYLSVGENFAKLIAPQTLEPIEEAMIKQFNKSLWDKANAEISSVLDEEGNPVWEN